MSTFWEPFLEERIEAARQKAQRLRDGIVEIMEEFELSLRVFISTHYTIPLFDTYFEERTLDDLIFEVEVIKLKQSAAPSGSNTLKENAKEAEGLFDDWIEDDEKKAVGLGNVDLKNDPFFNDAKAFMESGEFKETEGEKT
jgi:hypothetical protein